MVIESWVEWGDRAPISVLPVALPSYGIFRRIIIIVNGVAKVSLKDAANAASSTVDGPAQSRLTIATTRPIISASSRLRSVMEGAVEPG